MTTTISGTTGVSQIQDGTVTSAKIVDGTIAPADLSGGQSGSAPIYGCRAWCQFNGTTAGTNAPIAGGNVTSITKNGTGDYTVNFSTALPSASFAWAGSASNTSVGQATIGVEEYGTGSKTTTTLRITVGAGNIQTDYPNVHVIVFC